MPTSRDVIFKSLARFVTTHCHYAQSTHTCTQPFQLTIVVSQAPVNPSRPNGQDSADCQPAVVNVCTEQVFVLKTVAHHALSLVPRLLSHKAVKLKYSFKLEYSRLYNLTLRT